MKDIDPIEQPKLVAIDKWKNSERICEVSLNRITQLLDFVHTSYGSIYSKLHLNFGKFSKTKKFAFLLPYLQILPIMFHYSTNPNEYTHPLLLLMICNNVQIAVSASIVFELLLISFPTYSAFFINELVQIVKKGNQLNSAQLYRIYYVFYHCLNISKFDLENSLDLIHEFADYIAFNCLCSEYPETRLLSLEIMKASTFYQEKEETTLKYFIDNNSKTITEKAFISLLSEFSTDSISVDRFPMISFTEALTSPFFLLWKFYFYSLTNEMINDENQLLLAISVRESFIDHIQTMNNFLDGDNYYNSMKLLFLFASSTKNFPITINSNSLQKNWISQAVSINQMIESYIQSLTSTKLDTSSVCFLSFDFSSLHSNSISNAISAFLELEHNDTSLEIFATFLHHISVQQFFDAELNKMTTDGQINQIFSLFDARIPALSLNLTSLFNTTETISRRHSNCSNSSTNSKRNS